MTPRSEINNRPINQAAAYWMRQVGEEPGWDQPIDQRESPSVRLSGVDMPLHAGDTRAQDQEW